MDQPTRQHAVSNDLLHTNSKRKQVSALPFSLACQAYLDLSRVPYSSLIVGLCVFILVSGRVSFAQSNNLRTPNAPQIFLNNSNQEQIRLDHSAKGRGVPIAAQNSSDPSIGWLSSQHSNDHVAAQPQDGMQNINTRTATQDPRMQGQSGVRQAYFEGNEPRMHSVVPSSAVEPTKSNHSKNGPGIPLDPPSQAGKNALEKPREGWSSTVTMVASLMVVLGLFFGLAWIMRRSSPKPFANAPSEVVQVLGRTPLAARQSMYVVRYGRKLLLVSSQLGQTQTLSEITDEIEVDRLCGLCEQHSSNSISNSFRQVFQQVTGSHAIPIDAHDGRSRRKSQRSSFDTAS